MKSIDQVLQDRARPSRMSIPVTPEQHAWLIKSSKEQMRTQTSQVLWLIQQALERDKET